MNLRNNKLIFYALIIGILGFLDATYLTIQHYKNVIPPCTISGCEIVLTSQYSTILGIPLALLGSFFYLTVIILALVLLTSFRKIILQVFYLFSITGLLVSLALLFLQAFVIKSFCQYCLISCATSIGIFILATLDYIKHNKKPKEHLDE
jgi:uncharacterized membrane protein